LRCNLGLRLSQVSLFKPSRAKSISRVSAHQFKASDKQAKSRGHAFRKTMKTMALTKVREKLDKNTLKLYTDLRFGTREHAIDLGPPLALRLSGGQ
jgi:hypothetical protein